MNFEVIEATFFRLKNCITVSLNLSNTIFIYANIIWCLLLLPAMFPFFYLQTPQYVLIFNSLVILSGTPLKHISFFTQSMHLFFPYEENFPYKGKKDALLCAFDAYIIYRYIYTFKFHAFHAFHLFKYYLVYRSEKCFFYKDNCVIMCVICCYI